MRQRNLSSDTFSIETPQNLLRTKKNSLRTFPLVRNFPLQVAANFLEHSFGALIEKVSPFFPAHLSANHPLPKQSPSSIGVHSTNRAAVVPRGAAEWPVRVDRVR